MNTSENYVVTILWKMILRNIVQFNFKFKKQRGRRFQQAYEIDLKNKVGGRRR